MRKAKTLVQHKEKLFKAVSVARTTEDKKKAMKAYHAYCLSLKEKRKEK